MEPPTCVQNAMMTKDKKPFTYTPGGIDLSEVRSPRMARRIERNANLGGVDDVPRPPPPSQPQDYSNLPPSTLAAMRPQPQVQVFPSGPPPPAPMKSRGGAVPPPPPMNIPPPPPPPTCPLPTQKIKTYDNQVLERPDMTKIIPEEPMKLLRKTGGPQPRKSIVDQMFEDAQRGIAPKSPPAGPQHSSPQYEQPQQRYQQGPPSPPQQQQSQPQPQQQYQQHQQQYQPSPPQYQPQPQPYQSPSPPHYQQPRQPRSPPQPQMQTPPPPPPQQKQTPPPKFQRPEVPVVDRQPQQAVGEPKTSTAHMGSLYIPPANQKKVASPPTPPERNHDSPNVQTPPLREAPRPWQAKKVQEELPPWAKRENVEDQQTPSPQVQQAQQSPRQHAPQQRWPANRPVQEPQPVYTQPKEMHTSQPYKQQPPHQPPFNNQQPVGVRIEIRTRPGMQYQDNQEERKPNAVYVTQPVVLQHPGGRIIPVKVEGSNGARTPNTPGAERSLNRQQSWGANTPTQSHAFKVIQKMTNTDGDDDYEDAPVVEHPPTYPQQFQQPADQFRRMKVNDGNHIASKFNQDDDSPTPYVHPSQQAPVPEPKKYTGSAIPSRSFKILQAMTAPDNASADDQNEESPYEQWGYDPYYPHYPPPLPYWHDYFHACCHHDPFSGFSRHDKNKNQRRTPTPGRQTPSTGRSTPTVGRRTPTPGRQTPTPKLQPPLPLWSYIPPPPYAYPHPHMTLEDSSCKASCSDDVVSPYDYYDPYRHYQYYGMPPMYPPPPLYPYSYNQNNIEEASGYSSTDEISTYSNVDQSSSKVEITPTLCVKEQIINNAEIETEESDTETEDDPKQFGTLRSIRSVQNINVYYEKEDSSQADDSDASEKEYYVEECSESTDDDIEESIVEDEGPHQLSVIYEESERTDSRLRTVSALSDANTIADVKSDDEEHSVSKAAPSARLPFKITVHVSDEQEEARTVLIKDGCITSFGNEFDAAFTAKPPTRDELACKVKEEESVESTVTSNEVVSLEDEGKQSDESEDWWGILGTEDDAPPIRSTVCRNSPKDVEEEETCAQNRQEDTEDTSEVATHGFTSNKDKNIDSLVDTTVKVRLQRKSKEENIKAVNEESKVVALEANTECKRKSIYEEFEEETEQIGNEHSGRLIEMESFVEKLEKMQKESGLWQVPLKKEISEEREAKEDIKIEDIPERNAVVGYHEEQDETVTNEPESQNTTCEGKEIVELEDEIDFWKRCSTSYNEYNSSVSTTVNESDTQSKTNQKVQQEENINPKVDIARESIEETNINSNTEEERNTDMEAMTATIGSTDVSDDSSGNEEPCRKKNFNENTPKSIKDRIEALRDSIKQRQTKVIEEEIKVSVKDKISVLEVNNQFCSNKALSTKSSVKSFEEYSEEEDLDSGVTSDMSRHISDTEEFPELKKLTKYQRAATHSRLFKLLQDECESETETKEEMVVDRFSKLSVRNRENVEESSRRDQLSLPLNKSPNSSHPSSGISSPTSINDKLVNELVQSLLKHKKGQVFKNMPKDKLFAAATKILQEEVDIENSEETDSFMSPLKSSTGYSTAAQTPQEFNNSSYDEYRQYYESWNDVGDSCGYDIIPSKAFKLLQEHASANRTGTIAGLLAKCPRVLSSKNIHKKLMRLLENPEDTPPNLESPIDSNEVTSAS
nr:unnamed protein product [Callosobruchus analis]